MFGQELLPVTKLSVLFSTVNVMSQADDFIEAHQQVALVLQNFSSLLTLKINFTMMTP